MSGSGVKAAGWRATATGVSTREKSLGKRRNMLVMNDIWNP
jgi:hypothetical protein